MNKRHLSGADLLRAVTARPAATPPAELALPPPLPPAPPPAPAPAPEAAPIAADARTAAEIEQAEALEKVWHTERSFPSFNMCEMPIRTSLAVYFGSSDPHALSDDVDARVLRMAHWLRNQQNGPYEWVDGLVTEIKLSGTRLLRENRGTVEWLLAVRERDALVRAAEAKIEHRIKLFFYQSERQNVRDRFVERQGLIT